MPDPQSLTEATLARLVRLAQGVGLGSDSISLIDTNEQIYKIEGRIRLTPHFESTPRTHVGGPKGSGKNKKSFPNFQAMADELAQQRATFSNGRSWVPEAIHEIEQAPGYGWGMNEARVTLPQYNAILSATEKCPACAGSGITPCPQCQGQQHVICPFCYGKKEEDCYNCFGTGEDPVHKGQRCPVCHGTRFAPCRYCQATGIMACPTCQGRGGLPCQACQGTGQITQETMIKAGANVAFQLGNTTDCPSGLLRTMDRIGVPNLLKGYADIELTPQDPEAEDKTLLTLNAKLPYAEMKIRFNGKAALVIAFGKKGHLSGVPPFLDAALTSKLNDLKAAASGGKSIEKLLKIKLIADALNLVLQRKTHPNDLRRLYPVGLSAPMASQILSLLAQTLKSATFGSRLAMALFGTGISAALIGAFYFSSLHQQLTTSLSPNAFKTIEILMPLLLMGGTYMAVEIMAKVSLNRHHPDIQVSGNQDVGKTGYTALALIALLDIAARFLPGYLGLTFGA